MSDFEFVNAPAHHCSVHRTPLGKSFVRYRGNDHAFIGLYLAPRPGNQPLAVFVLRRIDGEHQTSFHPLGERGRRHWSRLYRPFGYALLIALLFAPPARVGSGRGPFRPVPANVGSEARSTVPDLPGGGHGSDVSSRALQGRGSVRPLGSDTLRTRDRRTRRMHLQDASRRLPASGSRQRAETAPTPAQPYAVVFGDFGDLNQAEAVARLVRAKGYRATVTPVADGVRVRGHRYPTLAGAARMAAILRVIGLPAHVEAVNVTGA